MPAPSPTSAFPTVLAFLKAPRLGTVKTRLAASIGDDAALAVYRHLGATQLERLPVAWPLEIHFTPSHAETEMREWLGGAHSLHAQSNGDLGQRLLTAIVGAFERGANGVVCIGADCPQLGATQLANAHAELEKGSDAVFGPTEDGGYYLIGMSRLRRELLQNIPWSASDTLETSLARARQAELSVALLPQLFDVDEACDLERAVSLGLIPPLT